MHQVSMGEHFGGLRHEYAAGAAPRRDAWPALGDPSPGFALRHIGYRQISPT